MLAGKVPIELKSNLSVTAYGARFILPDTLGDQPHRVLFRGENIHNFRWQGGHFEGKVFDPDNQKNYWPPSANTRAILISTTADGETSDLTFRDISSHAMAGAVVTVLGSAKAASEREILRYAHKVTIENCTLERSGKFMWDYGFLWQITIGPKSLTQHNGRWHKSTFA